MEPQHYIGRKVTIKDSGSVRQYQVCALTRDEDKAYLADGGKFHSLCRLDRLEVLPIDPHYGSPAYKVGYTQMGSMHIHSDEATEFFAFVMMQAGSLFQNVPEPATDAAIRLDDGSARAGMPLDESRNELERLLTIRGETRDGPVVTAALAYYDAAFAWYQADKAKHDD